MTARKRKQAPIKKGKLEAAAKAICGKFASESFLSALEPQVAMLASAQRGYACRPYVADMRERLSRSRISSELLAKELANLDFATTATTAAPHLNYLSLSADLKQLAASIKLAEELLRTRRGPDRAPSLVDGGIAQPTRPSVLCALLVLVAWKRTRGTRARHTTQEPWRAAEVVWAAANLDKLGENEWAWQDSFREAKKIERSSGEAGSLAKWFITTWATGPTS